MTARSRRRRSAVAIVAILAVVGVFVVKLVDIQVVRADELDKQSTASRAVPTAVFGTRGDILDTHGVTLAGTVMRYDVSVSPVDAKQEDKATYARDVANIGAVTGLGGPAVQKILSDALAANPKSQYASIAKGVDVTVLTALEKLKIQWLYYHRHDARTYPDGAVAGNIVGFVGSEGQAQAGVELGWNSCLAGKNGEETYQRGADGTPIPGSTVTTKKARDGGDIRLTLDADLQWFSQQKLAEAVKSLGATYGAVTIEEIKTGKLRTVAEYPSVDPNNVSATPPESRGSRAFQSPFEPGSTFKAVTASSLIDAGVATPLTHVVSPYHFTSGKGADLTDDSYHKDERLTLTGVLVRSSNTAISKLSTLMSNADRYAYMLKYGLDAKTAVGFPAESAGILNPYQKWDDQTKYATSFGQGLAITSIQLASIYQTLGNGGLRLPVQLVEGCTNKDGAGKDGIVTDKTTAKPTRVVSAKTAEETVNMLEAVVNKGENTKKESIPGYRIAAKTGTAQQADGNGGYKSSYFVSVTGLAPAENPQYVVSVNIANPVTIRESPAAIPLFTTIMTQVLKKYRIKPATTSPPDYPPYY